MVVQTLGYIGIDTQNLEDWGEYGTRLLGLQKVDGSKDTLAFRMDDRKQRLVVENTGGAGIKFYGWEVADAAAMEQIGALFEAAGHHVRRGSQALADQRHVKELIITQDPVGQRIEIFHGPAVASDPFRPGRNISGFRTGTSGLGHVAMMADSGETVDRMMDFYASLLGFRLTDYYSEPFKARFMHVNERHHSLAIVETGKTMVHHLMMELYSFDDVGQGYDLALAEEGRVSTTLGRHTSDYMTSFYTWTPSKFMVEYGWGGRSIDTDTWEPHLREGGPSLWGHERSWAPEETRKRAQEMRMELARQGKRAPVQVLEGNYQRTKGICPWWDSISGT